MLLHIIRAAIALPLPERTADLQTTDHGQIICVLIPQLELSQWLSCSKKSSVAGLKGICSFVFEREDDFPQILAFTNAMSKQYDLNVHTLHDDFRSGVEGMLQTTDLKAIILGTRRYSQPSNITADHLDEGAVHSHLAASQHA